MEPGPGWVPYPLTEVKRQGLIAQRRSARRRTAVQAPLVVFVALWALLAQGPDAPAVRWATLALALFASLALTLTLMLEMEHEVDWPEPPPTDSEPGNGDRRTPFDYRNLNRFGPAVLLLGLAQVAFLVGLVVHRGVKGTTQLGAWVPWVVGLLVAVVVIMAVLAAFRSRTQPPGVVVDEIAEGGTVPADLDQMVVACSGGGIRASAFVLGGMQALQHPPVGGPWAGARTAGPTLPAYVSSAPRYVAVSGGSYMAAAQALTRHWEVVEEGGRARTQERAVDLPWTESFSLLSPELQRLRRHTRALFEPATHAASGLLALVAGALVNIVIFVGGIRLVSWVLWWLMTAAGLLVIKDVSPEEGVPETARLVFFAGLDGKAPWGVDTTIGITVVLLAVAAGFTVRQWWWQRQRDSGILLGRRSPSQPDHVELSRRRQLNSAAVLLAWVGTALLVPALLLGVTSAALQNAPTPTIARLVHGLGLTSMPLCREAAGQSVLNAAAAAAADASISPGETRSYEAGACGFTTKVEFTLDKTGSVCPVSPKPSCGAGSEASWRALGADFVSASSFSSKAALGGQITGVVAVMVAILGALRRAPNTESATKTGLRARLQRLFLAWVPLAVVVLVTVYLGLKWIFQSLVNAPSSISPWQVALPLLALGMAIWLDANVTSMHGFYRRRLSSAFAAGRIAGRTTREAGDAVELDPTWPYRFSELRDSDLSIVTTANIRSPESTPTRRGGIPVVFNRERVSMEAGPAATLPTKQYEEAAGVGRTTIMATVAISGAAVSAMAGRFAAQVAPFRLLMTLFNVRLGVWVPNPLWGSGNAVTPDRVVDVLRTWPRAGWLSRRPGSVQVLVEGVGRSALTDRWIYLTDGGHLDNTGLVEAVRLLGRRGPDGTVVYSGRVLVLDASNDRLGTWEAVGDALAVLRADLGLWLEPEPRYSKSVQRRPQPATRPESEGASTPPPDQPTPAARPTRSFWRRALEERPEPDFARVYRGGDELTVVVVKAVRPKEVATSELPDSVKSFALVHEDFPRASTSRQDFGDLEFEAYRTLGEWCTGSALSLFEVEPERSEGHPPTVTS